MGFTTKDFWIKGRQAYCLDLIAGGEELYGKVKWIYLLEDTRNIDFIKGGELVITTGLESWKKDWLHQFLTELSRKQVCGIILNTGKYIQEVPEFAVSFCQEHGIPLFTMPWEIRISDVMQDCCNSILLEQQKTGHLQSFYGAALFEKSFSKKHVSCPEHTQVPDFGTYQILALNDAPLSDTAAALLESYFSHKELKFFTYSRNRKSYYLLYHPSAILNLDPEELKACLKDQSSAFGLSLPCSSFMELYQIRMQAEKAAQTASAVRAAYCRYENLGLYDLVLSVGDPCVLQRLYASTLKPLAKHDALHGTNYLDILRLYIRHNSSIQAVADETRTHRNTIDYRMQRIRQILGSDFSSMEERCRLQVAFCIHDLMH